MIGIVLVGSCSRRPARELVAVEARHHHVQHCEVGRAVQGEVERGLPVGRGHDVVALALEAEADEGEDVRVVVRDEDERPRRLRGAHEATPACAPSSAGWPSGSSTRKVVPTSSSLVSVMRPSCASTIAFEIARPRPVPWIACWVAVDVR
jgi:hypothetical protein